MCYFQFSNIVVSSQRLADEKSEILNAGYDMQFDIKYAYYNLVEALSATI